MNEQLLDVTLSDCLDYVEGIAELLHDALEYCDNSEDLARINELIQLINKLYSSLI
jgi:hypothetical protein